MSYLLSNIIVSETAQITIGKDNNKAKAGDSFFVTVGNKKVVIIVKCECIVTRKNMILLEKNYYRNFYRFGKSLVLMNFVVDYTSATKLF